MLGNFKNLNLHLDGLYKMVEMRGGFNRLEDRIKSKVVRQGANIQLSLSKELALI